MKKKSNIVMWNNWKQADVSTLFPERCFIQMYKGQTVDESKLLHYTSV